MFRAKCLDVLHISRHGSSTSQFRSNPFNVGISNACTDHSDQMPFLPFFKQHVGQKIWHVPSKLVLFSGLHPRWGNLPHRCNIVTARCINSVPQIFVTSALLCRTLSNITPTIHLEHCCLVKGESRTQHCLEVLG